MTYRRVAFLLIFTFLLGLGITRTLTRDRSETSSPFQTQSAQPRGIAGTPGLDPLLPLVAHQERHAERANPSLGGFTTDQARAFAAAGMAEDGNLEKLNQLNSQEKAVLPHMQKLLELQTSHPNTSTSTFAQASQSGPISEGQAGWSNAAGNAAQAPATLDCSRCDRGIQGTADGITLTSDQVWALARLDPSKGQLVITNKSTGDYSVSLLGSDFGTIRVNGGLVVPGRNYLVHGSVTVTGSCNCAIHIRPISIAATVYLPLTVNENG